MLQLKHFGVEVLLQSNPLSIYLVSKIILYMQNG